MKINDVYASVPVLEDDRFLLRAVSQDDAADLLRVYSDEKAVPLFNSDNCHGDDFHYQTLERMQQAIGFWAFEYARKGFVRWAIVDKQTNAAIGTIELFHRTSGDAFNHCGLLRLDLRSDYEQEASICDILSLILEPGYALFDCSLLATKAIPAATERVRALNRLGFSLSDEFVVAPDGRQYKHYYTRVQ